MIPNGAYSFLPAIFYSHFCDAFNGDASAKSPPFHADQITESADSTTANNEPYESNKTLGCHVLSFYHFTCISRLRTHLSLHFITTETTILSYLLEASKAITAFSPF